MEELIVINYLTEWFESLSISEMNDFIDEFPVAYESLKWIKNQDPDYNQPFIGQAYAFKFHLSRNDQLRMAIHHLNNISPLFEEDRCRILDVGAGTGAGIMAVMSQWASEPREDSTCKIYGFEPSRRMREVAYPLIRVYHEQCSNTSNFDWQLGNADIIQCARFCRKNSHKRIFDLVIFNHVFWVMPEIRRLSVLSAVQDIVSLIKPSGKLLIITPNEPIPKREFTNWLKSNLIDIGMIEIGLDVPNAVGVKKADWPMKRGYPAVSFAPHKRPPSLVNLMKAIQKNCKESSQCTPFGKSFGENDDDYPFYGFWGRRKDDPNLTPMVDVLGWQ